MLKNRLTYGAVVFVLFIFIYLRDSSMTYTAFYAALIMPVISIILARISKRNLAGLETLGNTFITKNETTEYKVKIQNNSFLPCFFACLQFDFQQIGLDADVNEAYISVKPFGSYELTIKISGKYRGIYDVGVKEIYIYDFLGLFKTKLKYDKELQLTIMPQIINIPELTFDLIQQGETIIKRHIQGKDYSIAAELREYLPTDSYKQIHWKATAKRNELISKDPQEIEQLSTIFFVDNLRILKTFERTLEKEDKMMDVVVSAMSHCHQLGHRMSLHSLNLTYREFTTDFTRLFHDAALIPFIESGDIHHALNNYLSLGNALENIFLFTQAVDKDLLASLQAFKLLGSTITVFLFGTMTKGTQRKFEVLDIQCICFE